VLRKLWLSDPALANLDELLDYGEDFTTKGADVVTTAYQAGKGYFNRQESAPDPAGKTTDNGPETTAEDSVEDGADDGIELQKSEGPLDPAPNPDADRTPEIHREPDIETAAALPRRRLKFSYPGDNRD